MDRQTSEDDALAAAKTSFSPSAVVSPVTPPPELVDKPDKETATTGELAQSFFPLYLQTKRPSHTSPQSYKDCGMSPTQSNRDMLHDKDKSMSKRKLEDQELDVAEAEAHPAKRKRLDAPVLPAHSLDMRASEANDETASAAADASDDENSGFGLNDLFDFEVYYKD